MQTKPEIFESLMRQSALFNAESRIKSGEFAHGGGWFQLRFDDKRPPFDSGVDLELSEDGKTLWLLSIEIPKSARGQGHGAVLYELTERVGHQFGCQEVVQTPSGTTSTGESRRQYLFRKGWLPRGNEVFKPTQPWPNHRALAECMLNGPEMQIA